MSVDKSLQRIFSPQDVGRKPLTQEQLRQEIRAFLLKLQAEGSTAVDKGPADGR